MPISVQINFKRKGVIAENIKLKFWLTKKKEKQVKVGKYV